MKVEGRKISLWERRLMWKGSDGIEDGKVMQNKFGWDGRIEE